MRPEKNLMKLVVTFFPCRILMLCSEMKMLVSHPKLLSQKQNET